MCVHVSVCTCVGMLIFKKTKKNMLIRLSLLIVYAALPVLRCVLSASHRPDFIFFQSLSGPAMLLILCFFKISFLLS